MSYQVLARKYRPRTFKEVAGQEHVLRALINALDQGRLHHAYLFTGTRGVGKTTLARILAKCLNCEAGVSATPCMQCNSCQEIEQGRFADLIEVDAASRTKVEDTRELLENVQYAPTRGRYKVYLIDEVHMLSGHSFNALLKTLEEPPPHVKFLLATTDPQRLPITVLSRCLQFNLKNLTPEQIMAQLEIILKQENISYENAALAQLARAANGSVRDALSLLDQAIAYSGNNQLNANDVANLLGTIEQIYITQLLTALAQRDGKALLATTAQLAERAADFNNVLEELLLNLHQIALEQIIPGTTNNSLAQQISREDIQLYYQIGLIGRRDLPLAPTPRSGFEMVLLRMLAFSYAEETFAEPEAPSRQVSQAQPNLQAIPNNDWLQILPQLNLSGLTQTLASHCLIKEQTDNRIHLILDPNQAALRNPRQEVRLAEALSAYFGRPVAIHISLGEANMSTPARLATQSLENDANIQSLMKAFDATIQPGSIRTQKSLLSEE